MIIRGRLHKLWYIHKMENYTAIKSHFFQRIFNKLGKCSWIAGKKKQNKKHELWILFCKSKLYNIPE